MKEPQITQGQISLQLAYILRKIQLFRKSVFSPPKFLMTFFFYSSTLIVWFPNFHHFIDQKLKKDY